MEVPFDQIGAAQKGRLVYQVMGQDGPIFNPNNIRFMSPEQAQDAGLAASSSSDLVGLSAGLAGVTLMTSMGSLALSAAILSEIKKVSAKIDELRKLSIQTLDRLDGIADRLNAIDIKVSENNLRHALNHVSRTCIGENSIDLIEIKKLQSDVTNFGASVDGYWYGSPASFTLSSDVRDRLNGLHKFLYGVRETVARRHNLSAGGDPMRVLTMHPVYDYIDPNSGYKYAPLLISKIIHDIWAIGYEVGNEVNSQFTWSSEEDIEKYANLIGEGLCDKVYNTFVETDVTAAKVSDSLIGEIDDNTDLEGTKNLVEEWELYWLLRTDMGLVWRTGLELIWLGDYKMNVDHWERVETKPLGSDQLLIDCSWKKAS